MSNTPRATAEDHALARKTPDEVRTEVSVYSFDIGSLKARVRSDDISQAFIQAHLYLDHVLSRVLLENVPFPRHLQLDRTGFTQKLQLVEALGLIGRPLVAPIRVINSIRNKIAHQIEYLVQPSDEARLRSTLSKGADQEADGSQTPLPDLLRLIAVMADIERQERAYEREMDKRARANVRVVLDETRLTPPPG